MTKIFQRERFSIFKSRWGDHKKDIFESSCRKKLEGELVLDCGVFYLDGREIFRVAPGTKREWQMWHQLYNELDDTPWFTGEYISRGRQSKKDWGYGSKSTWKSSRRDIRWASAERRREEMARSRAENGKR